MTVATVSRDRTVERLDHAATTVRTAIGAMCRQLQAVADAVAVLPADQRRPAADQMVSRGLAVEVRILGTGEETPLREGERDCVGTVALTQGEQSAGGTAVVARALQGDVTVLAVERVDAALVRRLAETSGAAVEIPGVGAAAEGGSYTRTVPVGPGQPLPLTVEVRSKEPAAFYISLALGVGAVAGLAILAARGLARSTTRPLQELAWAAGKVADGELGVRVPVGRGDEIGQLAGAFNRMTRELQAYVQALTASRDQLRGHLAILGDTLSSTHDVHRILQVILQTALSATGARAGIVLLTEPAAGRLVARCAEGLTGRWDVPECDLPSLSVPVGGGILGTIAAGGEARRGLCGLSGGPVDEPACRTYVAVPICAPATVGDPLVPGGRATEGGRAAEGGRPAILGVLALYDRLGADEFDDSDLLTLRTFAGQAGIAVHNVRIHEEAQRLSLTDPLTGLWNYRYLRESLRREVERANRFGRMLTVLVLDLDHFKDVNDTYGHAAGDTVLEEFARRIRIGLREVDVAFRQGGEEFVVLLPETDAYGGIVVAERLGAAVRGSPVPIDPRRVGAATGVFVDRVSVSVSIGIAVYPEHGATAQQVLDAADDALYAAKNGGRDTYRIAEVVPLPSAGPVDPMAGLINPTVGLAGTASKPVDPVAGRAEAGSGQSEQAVSVTDPSVSGGVEEGNFDHPGPVTGASGGPQPPRQSRGR
ncbi:diguanylate cyclase [Actinoplanes sp. NPDC051494]|uniref:diguanylate cyclase n=1 Tax=Actinoplanes sp. NPDC051494 TaxID=3363907 RepID=UPI00378EADE3